MKNIYKIPPLHLSLMLVQLLTKIPKTMTFISYFTHK